MSEGAEGKCQVCQEPAKQRCSQCKIVFYCSAEHQKANWKDHRNDCSSYEVSTNTELGRFLIAKRDIARGEVIFVDTPLVYGPKPFVIEDGPVWCVGCCKVLLDEFCGCLECGWPICAPNCRGLDPPRVHARECQVLKLRPPRENDQPIYSYFRYDTLTVLRALLLQKTDPKKWKVLLDLEDHLSERGPDSDTFKVVEEKVAYIQKNYIAPLKAFEAEHGKSVLPDVSDEIIRKIYAVLDVNATEISEPADMFVLYPIASLLEHNCVPNTQQSVDDKDDYKITFRAALPIAKGSHITTTYTNILWGTQERRAHLKKLKYFSCICQRCCDPTELGTFFSALICLGAEEEPCKGVQLPLEPTAPEPDWVCDKCAIKLPNDGIASFVDHLSAEVDKQLEKRPEIEALEDFLNKLEVFLHPHHFLVYALKHSIVQMYKTDGDIEISDEFLKVKLDMCRDLIDVTKKLDPGNSRLALYLAVLLNEQFTGEFKRLERSLDLDNKEGCDELIGSIFGLIRETKEVLNYERNSEAGEKLYGVICAQEKKFEQWLQKNDITIVNKN